MARLGSRGSSAGHTSESACAASLAALAGADFSQGSGDDSGANRRPGISGHTLREHFHLPLHTVALKFGMCTTAFKKMCRRMGIAKWPHRQVWLIRPPPMRGASWVRRSTESSRRVLLFPFATESTSAGHCAACPVCTLLLHSLNVVRPPRDARGRVHCCFCCRAPLTLPLLRRFTRSSGASTRRLPHSGPSSPTHQPGIRSSFSWASTTSRRKSRASPVA
jgi:hypothetical protein